MNVMELIVYKKKLPLIVASRLFLTFCKYLKNEIRPEMLDREMFAAIFKCSLAEVEEKLLFNHPSLRVVNSVGQLSEKEHLLEANSLLYTANQAHKSLLNVNSFMK